MYMIKFKYKDAYTNGEWRDQMCIVSSVAKCIEIYGLDRGDVEYQIISIEEQ